MKKLSSQIQKYSRSKTIPDYFQNEENTWVVTELFHCKNSTYQYAR